MKTMMKRMCWLFGMIGGFFGLGGCTETDNLTAVGNGFVGLFNLAGDGVMALVKWATTGTLIIALMLSGGCADKTINATDQLMQNNLKPIIEKVMEDQSVKDMVIQANAQAINPAIVISGEGKYVQGIEWNIVIKADGTAANLMSTTTSDRKATTQPATSTQPASTQ